MSDTYGHFLESLQDRVSYVHKGKRVPDTTRDGKDVNPIEGIHLDSIRCGFRFPSPMTELSILSILAPTNCGFFLLTVSMRGD